MTTTRTDEIPPEDQEQRRSLMNLPLGKVILGRQDQDGNVTEVWTRVGAENPRHNQLLQRQINEVNDAAADHLDLVKRLLTEFRSDPWLVHANQQLREDANKVRELRDDLVHAETRYGGAAPNMLIAALMARLGADHAISCSDVRISQENIQATQ